MRPTLTLMLDSITVMLDGLLLSCLFLFLFMISIKCLEMQYVNPDFFITMYILSHKQLWLSILCHCVINYQMFCPSKLVLGIGLKNQNRLIGNSEQSIIDYNYFSACFVRKTEYSFLPNIITVVFR